MATTAYTDSLRLALPVSGELDGGWGDVVNDNITAFVETAVAGLQSISTWDGSNLHTLTTNNDTADESRAMILDLSGSPTGAATVVCPAKSKVYVVRNGTGESVTVKTSGGTGIAVPDTYTAFLFCDGTNVNDCHTSMTGGIITASVISGGTIDNAVIGGTTAQAGSFTTLSSSGAATLNSLATSSANIDGGSIDGTIIGGSTAADGDFVDLGVSGTATVGAISSSSVDINGGTIDGTPIGNSSRSSGKFTTLDSSGAATLSSLSTSSADINGGTIDGTVIGNASKSSGDFTTLSANSTVNFNSAGTVQNPSGDWDTGGINLDSGKTYGINSQVVLSSDTLGTNVVNSSLTSVGTITSGTWQGAEIDWLYLYQGNAILPGAVRFSTSAEAGEGTLTNAAVTPKGVADNYLPKITKRLYKSADYTLTDDDNGAIIVASQSGSTFTIRVTDSLPAGFHFRIVRTSSNAVNVGTNSTENLNGALSAISLTRWDSVYCFKYGTNAWSVGISV